MLKTHQISRSSQEDQFFSSISGSSPHSNMLHSLILLQFSFQPWSVYGWTSAFLDPQCPQAMRCHRGEIEPFSVTLAQFRLEEQDQPGKNPSF